MNTIVIFGGCGFIGLYFAEEVLNKKLYNNIYLVDIKEPNDEYLKLKYQIILSSGKVKFIKSDVRHNLNEIPISETINTIINFAAIHKEPGHLDSEYLETNIEGAKNICNFAENKMCKNIIFTSSIAVYGVGNHEKNESSPTNPIRAYGKSKLAAEEIFLSWQKKDPTNRILSISRPGVVFGAGEKGNVTRLIKIIKKKFFVYMGNKHLQKAGIYIKELTNVLIWINEKQKSKEIHNFALYNAAIVPCPTLEHFSISICQTLNISNKFITIPFSVIKFILFICSFVLKRLNKNNSLNYMRVKKLFISNNIKSNFLIDNLYHFKYDLVSAFDDWKKNYPQDWL
jgi:GlcNAc-P-P-Und epimerase